MVLFIRPNSFMKIGRVLYFTSMCSEGGLTGDHGQIVENSVDEHRMMGRGGRQREELRTSATPLHG